jgi:hypothetical protein
MDKYQNFAELSLSVFYKLYELDKMRDMIKCMGWYRGFTNFV